MDADAGYNGTVVYSIKSSTAANTFSIDGNNGETFASPIHGTF